jgi:hypothetical protein
MGSVIIYKLPKNVMQSGSNHYEWCVEEVLDKNSSEEQLMGWTTAKACGIKVYFNTKEDALSYAQRENLNYKVLETTEVKRNKKSYTFNFTKDPNLYYY